MDHIAANASKALESALFVSFNAAKIPTLSKEKLPEVLRGLNNLLDLTATKSSKVLDATELVGCDNDSYMDTLGDVLLGSPVAYVSHRCPCHAIFAAIFTDTSLPSVRC